MKSQWYVAMTRCGANRAAKPRVWFDVLARQGGNAENEIERSLRDAGFECYYPRMRKEIRHHRTRQIMVRAFPLFPGYVFVRVAPGEFMRLANCDFVGDLLGIDGEPVAVPASSVERIRTAEDDLVFDDTREARLKRREEGRTIRDTIEQRLPAGSHVVIRSDATNPFAGFSATVDGVTSRGQVRAMVDLFGRLTPCEFDAVDLEAA